MYKKNIDIGFEVNWDKLPDEDRFKQVVKFLYDTDPNLKQHVIINGLPIFFNRSNKVIGVNLSGGADSTLLLYLLCKIITTLNLDTTIVASTFIRFWEDRGWSEGIAKNVVSYISKEFPAVNIIHEFGFVPTALEVTPLKNLVLHNQNLFPAKAVETAFADVYAVRDYTRYLAAKHGYTTTYGGSTANPDHITELAPKFRQMRQLDLEQAHSVLHGSPIQDPFFLINKTWVMAQYDNFKIRDLLTMTRSCSSGIKTLNNVFGLDQWTVTDSNYSCGECFFCKERKWADDNRHVYLEENCKQAV